MDSLLKYEFGGAVDAFSTRKCSKLPYEVILGGQVHDIKTAVITEANPDPSTLEGVDALVTNIRGVAIGIRTADCVPILLYDSENSAVAAIHSGWKGTLRRILNSALTAMSHNYGTEPENIKAQIGPCISGGSFQVGEEVPQAFKELGFPMERIYSWNGPRVEGEILSGHHIDLVEANLWLMEEAGLVKNSIRNCGIDSYLETEFFSVRREGTGTGRIITSIMLK